MREASIILSMTYVFATEARDYSDYAGGRVIYSLPGCPAFPVRLVSEMFQRAMRYLRAPVCMYDPCCGGAYHLVALGFLHGAAIRQIVASDVDAEALSLAQRNLGLLHPAGLAKRQAELRALWQAFGKSSHAEALRSAESLQAQLERTAPAGIPSRVFAANALQREGIGEKLQGERVDLVLSDLPYGWLTGWQLPADAAPDGPPPVTLLLESLYSHLHKESVVALATDKAQKIHSAQYVRLERFQVGKRVITLLRPVV